MCRLIFFLSAVILLLHYSPINATRVGKISKQRLHRIQELVNDGVERKNALLQNDAVDLFSTIQRDPKARRNHDELSVNNADEYYQGDVDLSESQADFLEKQVEEGKRVKRKVGRSPIYKKWDTSRPISFDFADSIPDGTRITIKSAMRLWQRHTCIRFAESGQDVDRLEFFDGGGCSSFVGRVGGTQGISISTPGCDTVGIISHEIGHSLGIFHEQARPDQERYIAINYNNIPLSRWNNFQSVGDDHAETFNLPYDTGSVMHYGPYGFATDPYSPTIRTLERTQQATIGQRAGPSFLDYQAINTAYGCSERCEPLPCLRNGYPHPNNCSTCACPDGLSGQFCEKVWPSNAECGGVIFAGREVRYINSPNYPEHFPINSECNWIIAAPAEGRVFMEFEEDFDFLCEDTCDKAYVEIKYHNDKRLTGARFCCSMHPKTRFISFNNEMIILMRGYSSSSKGFRAKFWSNIDGPNTITTTTEEPEITTPFTTTKQTTIMTSIPTTTTTERTTTITDPPLPEVTETIPNEIDEEIEETTRSVNEITEVTTTSTENAIQTLFPSFSTLIPPITPIVSIVASTESPDVINSVLECGCGSWTEWQGSCTQECGGCGHRLRVRECKKDNCRTTEKRACNFKACPDRTNFLINNAEFHILWRGCCVGMFRSAQECTALEAEANPFLKIINSLLNVQDSKMNATLAKRIMRGEH